jgi:hypothetical protein
MGFGYRLGIRELIYNLVMCCPDLLYAIARCAQSSMCPAEIHYHAIKHILKYLYLTRHDGLHYWHPQPNDSPFLLRTYPKSIVRRMIYSWMAAQFMIALTFKDMWTLIGLPALRHVAHLLEYVFASLVGQLHTSPRYNTPWLSPPQKPNSWVPLTLVG